MNYIFIKEQFPLIDVPENVEVCPYCCGKLKARIESWEQDNKGYWYADLPSLECENEPEIDDKWDELSEIEQHIYMPYEYWLPAQKKVEIWLKGKYRFILDED